ncbi:MAG TPA: phosphatase PAP2 family protein [Polyangiaceae bacterium]|nr:phosphatase PAP2 family protein [Polyangiaceae bacterium]
MVDSRLATKWLFGTAALAALSFAAVTSAVLRGKTQRFDQRAKRRVHGARVDMGHGRALRTAALSTTPLGKWWGYLPASFATARQLLLRGRGAGAAAVAGTALLAALTPPLLKKLLPQRLAPPERDRFSKHSYPSGHALQTSAVAVITSYVLLREGMAPRWFVAPAGLASLAAGAGRLLLDRHWTSDVIGGYCAGIALGATGAGVYELTSVSA